MKPYETVDYQIKSTWHTLSRMYNHIASEYGMSLTIGYVLMNISKEGTPATKIAPLMGMEPTSLSRLLKTMEDNTWIYREKDENDKRIVRIYLTDEGLLKRKVAELLIHKFNDALRQAIPAQELGIFFRVMEKINAFANTYEAPKHKRAQELNF